MLTLANQAVLLTPEDRQEFDDLESSYTAELAPRTSVERTQLGQLILATWNMRRSNRLEAALAAADGIDPLLSPKHEKTLQRITTARIRAERIFNKSLKELQAARRGVNSKGKNEPNLPPAKPATIPTDEAQQLAKALLQSLINKTMGPSRGK